MDALQDLAARIAEPGRDLRLNLDAVLRDSVLTDAQRWGVALAAAIAARHPELRDAVAARAAAAVEPAVLDDARAAAALMAMNNIYYRFRHMMGESGYAQRPARLRMTRIARPATNKADFELFCLAVSAINGCAACVRSHEAAVRAGGLSEDAVHDAVRIAAALHGAAVALELA